MAGRSTPRINIFPTIDRMTRVTRGFINIVLFNTDVLLTFILKVLSKPSRPSSILHEFLHLDGFVIGHPYKIDPAFKPADINGGLRYGYFLLQELLPAEVEDGNVTFIGRRDGDFL